MKSFLWFLAGGLVATAVVTRIKPASESSCCTRVAYGARDRLAGYTGPLSSVTSWAIDKLGLTSHLPGALDTLGVPADA